jgi:DNA-binding transcriptional LysR family regulator
MRLNLLGVRLARKCSKASCRQRCRTHWINSLVVCIANAGSITHGARHASLAVGSASERLKIIEDDIGAKLFSRHPRGVSLTECGELLVLHARDLLTRHDRLKTELGAYVKGGRGKILLYANTSAMAEFLPVRLAKWLSEYLNEYIEL